MQKTISGISPLTATSNIEAPLQALREAIWARRPILGEIMQQHGTKNLYEYARDFMDVNPSPLLDQRKNELIAVVEELLHPRLGSQVAAGVARQLRRLALVSTTDHHGIIQHPFFLNANIISALPYSEFDDTDLRYLVVFSFASVSLNCSSNYSRGLMFHGGMNGSGNMIRLPILPDKIKMGVVHATRAFTKEDLERAKKELAIRVRGNEVLPGVSEKVLECIHAYIATDDVLAAPDLSTQSTMINFKMWPHFFHQSPTEPPRAESARMPDLIYLEIETLVTELLLRSHLADHNSLIHKVLFHPNYRPLVLTHFDNLPGSFSLEKEWGSYFFWGLDDNNHRMQLKLVGNRLCSFDGTISIPFTSQDIAASLRKKEIFPGMLLCYLMVSLYYGIKCLGGFCQVNDLTMTKVAWTALLREIGEHSEADAVVPVQTKELSGDGLVLAYLHTAKGEMVPATGIDMLIDDHDRTYQKYIDRSKDVTLTEMMNPLLPEIYTVIYSLPDRDPTLQTLTPEQIARETGLQEKLTMMREMVRCDS